MKSYKAPTLSIVTVTFNDLVRLQETAVSLNRQLDHDFEWIVVDGFSRDTTEDYITNLQVKFVKIFIQSIPVGIYNAMNIGIQQANNGYIWFLNAGDTLLSRNAISIVKDEIVRLEALAIAFPVVHVSKSGFLTDISIPRIEIIQEYQIADLNHQGAVICAEILESMGGFDESFKFAADGKLLDSVQKQYGFSTSDEIFIGFEMGGTAARQYRETVKETQRYRPQNYSDTAGSSLKNFIRLRLLTFEKTPILGLIPKLYFYTKQNRLRKFSQSKFHLDLRVRN
jgi:putative colanic acid biosynthesis glycosyltransferase